MASFEPITARSTLTLAVAAPASKIRLSPMTISDAAARASSSATSFAVSSGLMPAGSPIARAITGRLPVDAFTSCLPSVEAVRGFSCRAPGARTIPAGTTPVASNDTGSDSRRSAIACCSGVSVAYSVRPNAPISSTSAARLRMSAAIRSSCCGALEGAASLRAPRNGCARFRRRAFAPCPRRRPTRRAGPGSSFELVLHLVELRLDEGAGIQRCLGEGAARIASGREPSRPPPVPPRGPP